MNGCIERNLDFIEGGLNSSCDIQNSTYFFVTNSNYINLSRIDFEVTEYNVQYSLQVCKYDKNNNSLGRQLYSNLELGSHSIDLDPKYKYRIAYSKSRVSNLKGYQCNIGIGSMSNELAFGSVKFNDTLNVIIPFIIVLIGFGLGFTLLRKLINKSNQGEAL